VDAMTNGAVDVDTQPAVRRCRQAATSASRPTMPGNKSRGLMIRHREDHIRRDDVAIGMHDLPGSRARRS
jgi:hypothetical protein